MRKITRTAVIASICLGLTVAALAFMLVRFPAFAYTSLTLVVIAELFMMLLPEKKDEEEPPEEMHVSGDVSIRRMDVADSEEETAQGCKRVALLIDADNIESWLISHIIKNIGLFHDAVVVFSCLYGNLPSMGSWQSVAEEYGFRMCFSEQFVIGKNSTDFKILIDCMDLLYQGNIDTFVLCSSDSDFTNIANRIRESGKNVFGMGMSTTPQIYRDACTRFVDLGECAWRDDVYEIIKDETEKNNGVADCNMVAKRVRELFDYKDMGYPSISALARDLGLVVEGPNISFSAEAMKNLEEGVEIKEIQKTPKQEPEWRIKARKVISGLIEENDGRISLTVALNRVTKDVCYYKLLGFKSFDAMVKSLGYRLTKNDHGKLQIMEKSKRKPEDPDITA